MPWSFGGGGSGGTRFKERIVVTNASQLSGTLDSTKEYFIDGIVDMGRNR